MDKKVTERIQERAYEFFVRRGGTHGHAMEDWLAAEREIAGSHKSKSTSRKKKEPALVR